MTQLGNATTRFASRLWTEVKAHSRSLDILVPLLFVILMVDILTVAAGVGANDDWGTYWDQGDAVLHGHLAHYTYWYDHPPVGWIQIALYEWLTNPFQHNQVGILRSGQFMIILQLISCVLIWTLMRRLRFNRAFAAMAVALFALNPIAVEFQKMGFLDNICVPWMLAALVLAASPRKSLGSVIGAGLCLAISTLSKETAVVFTLPVLYLLWQNHGKGRRLWANVMFLGTYLLVGGLYFGYAAQKNELFPGPGHVSLIGSLIWQLGRPSASNTLGMWLSFDKMLMYFALAALPLSLVVKRLRPISVGFLALALMIAKGGYLPAPFVLNILPFAAMLVAGVLGALWPYRGQVAQKVTGLRRMIKPARVVAVLAAIVVILGMAAPKWHNAVSAQTPRGEIAYYNATIQAIEQTVPKDAVIAVDDNMWYDLKQAGYKNVVWFYKLDLDPAIAKKYVPHGYEGIDYVVLKEFYFTIAAQDGPTSVVIQAQQHSSLMGEFGNTQSQLGQYVEPYQIYKVNKDGTTTSGVSQ